MKLAKLSNTLFYVGVVILSSCGSGADKKTTATDSTATADSAAKTQAVNTIITTPRNVNVITHKVADYSKWLTAYEAHDSARLAAGIHNYVIGRGFQDSNLVLVVTRVDDTSRAKAFVKDPSLKAAMKKGGVMGAPTIELFTETWLDTAKAQTDLRSVVMFTVKDWDAWFKAFEEGKQERIDNGVIDRVVGHALNNDKKVSVVTELVDSTKAFAYFKSDALKKRRQESGVTGEPVRLIFRIAKMY